MCRRNRYLSIIWITTILATTARAQTSAHVDVALSPGTWSYTLFNDEPLGSSNFLSAFFLQVSAPITVTGSPSGWSFTTDNVGFVFWFNLDGQLPYPNDVAAGAALGGFEISSAASVSQLNAFDIGVWDHVADVRVTGVPGEVLTPSLGAAAPEPGSLTLGLTGLVGTAIHLRIRRKGKASREDQA